MRYGVSVSVGLFAAALAAAENRWELEVGHGGCVYSGPFVQQVMDSSLEALELKMGNQ